jgi:hypothetical protein
VIADRLFRLTARDSQVTPLDIVLHQDTGTFNSTGIAVRYTVPNTSVLLLSSYFAEANAGAAQVAQILFGEITLPFGQIGTFFDVLRQAAGTNLRMRGEPAQVMVPPGYSVRFEAVFSAAVAANALTAALTGVLVPRGNTGLTQLAVTVS